MLQIRIGNRCDRQGLGFGGTQILRYIKVQIFCGIPKYRYGCGIQVRIRAQIWKSSVYRAELKQWEWIRSVGEGM